ncbi:30001_t:CDS:2 [Gigaspora margarita]|uniref:30001_t:CDS:1 n=1 Tax=Gigaspora margarita TaxID=4874 RepID=A0ABN7V819_GIGMA|nr:30001_t:CDS:2 [Gigaspora margarita]
MEDKLTIAALEVNIDFTNLKAEYSFSPFDIECTTTIVIEVEKASSNLEVGFTSSVLEIEKTLSSLVFQNDKDPKDSSITRRKSFCCSLSGTYSSRKNIDQNLHRLRNCAKINCGWHCNFTFPKTIEQISCTTLDDVHNHELQPGQIAHLNARYRQLNKKPDSSLFLEALFKKIVHNLDWKVYIRHLGTNALVEDEMASTYAWILRCLMKATTFYSCRNILSIELFEQCWKFMIETFPECHNYMTRTLYANHLSWAKSYVLFQFNAGIQSIQSMESFNGIIKKSLNSASTLCDVEKVIKKRLEDESQYNKLILEIDTVNDAFIEDITDELQITLKFLLNSVEFSSIAFTVSKTAINIALETNNSTRSDSNNSCKNSTKNESYEVVPLQQQLISQITEPKVVKICSAPFKKRMKSFTEEMCKKVNVQESNHGETSSQAQHKCLLCGAPGHYQKKCPGYNKENIDIQ